LLSGYPPYYPHFDKKRAIEERVPTLVPTRQIPPLLGTLVMHMLAKDPKRRPRTMREVIDELDAALNDTLTYDFENVSPATPTASTAMVAAAAAGSVARASSPAESSATSGALASTSTAAGAAASAPKSQGTAAHTSRAPETNTSDSQAKSSAWTPDGGDRRASPDRRGRRKEDSTPQMPREPTIPSDLSGVAPTAEASSAEALSGGASSSGPSAGGASSGGASADAARAPRRSGADALARIDAALERAASDAAAHPKPPNLPPITPAEAAAIVAAARAAASQPLRPQSAPFQRTPERSAPSSDRATPTSDRAAAPAPEHAAAPAFGRTAAPAPERTSAAFERGSARPPRSEEPAEFTIPASARPAPVTPASAPPASAAPSLLRGAPATRTPSPPPGRSTAAPAPQSVPGTPTSSMWPLEGRAPSTRTHSTPPPEQVRASAPGAAGASAPGVAQQPGVGQQPGVAQRHGAAEQPGVASQHGASQQQFHTIPAQPTFRHSTVSVGTYPDPTSIPTRNTVQAGGPMNVNWSEVTMDGLPKVVRLQPIRPRRWPWVVFGLVAGAAAAIYFWLPRFDTQTLPPEVAAVVDPIKTAVASVSPTTPSAPVATASAASGASTETPPAQATAVPAASTTSAPTAADEQRLRQMRQSFDNRLASLEARGAGVWGGHEFAMAKTRAAESVGARDAGNPRVAQERLAAATKLLDTVESKAPQALSAQVAAGEQALGAGQQEVAGQAFDLARRISPSDRRASDGQRRAQNLPAVLPLLADAQNAEVAHDYARAAQDYSQALSLDPGNATAKAGQARSNAAFGDDNYAKAVGAGFAALGAGRLDEAHEAFVKARALKPNGAEASEGLRRVGAALNARGFASMRQRAIGLEAQERWDEAERTYEDVLAADSSLAFAQEGKARATSRADLSVRLQQLLDRPDRLSSPGVRDDARALLETARAQSPQGPVIRSQIARLDVLLPSFDKPVRLSLVSDNSTQVAISSIGAFGAFSRRDIELRPGKYTVVGTRNGFRDVRREITVAPGQDSQTIRVTCSEPI
jgi:tetratricopeptide (TPR) repeat protein